MGGVIAPKRSAPPVAKPVEKAFTELAEDQGKKLSKDRTPGTQEYADSQSRAARRRARAFSSRSLLGGGRDESGTTKTTLGS